MKKLILLLILCLMFSGCAKAPQQDALPPMEKPTDGMQAPTDSEGAFIPSAPTDGILEVYMKGSVSIALTLPEGWAITPISTHPQLGTVTGFELAPKGKTGLIIGCAPDFAICADKISIIDTTLAGYPAWQYAPYARGGWWFTTIVLEDCSYVVYSNSTPDWWARHQEEANAILETLVLGPDIQDRYRLIPNTMSQASIAFDRIQTKPIPGGWTVTFWDTSNPIRTRELTYWETVPLT